MKKLTKVIDNKKTMINLLPTKEREQKMRNRLFTYSIYGLPLATDSLTPFDHRLIKNNFGITMKDNEDKSTKEIKAIVLGYGKEDLEVSFSNYGDQIIITSKDSKLKTSVRISDMNLLDTDAAKAKCLNGILTITIPYKAEQRKKIEIK